MSKIAIDTNVLIYLHDINSESAKRSIASELIADGPVISSQVVSEYLNVCNRKLKLSKQDSLASLMSWLQFCELAEFKLSTYTVAIQLIKKYQFQMFDAVIVASSLGARCSVLYSEDMQHELLIEKQLRIVNPFSKSV